MTVFWRSAFDGCVTTKAIVAAAVLYAAACLGATSAFSGEIHDFFETLGGCQTSSSPMMALEQHLSTNSDLTYLGKAPGDWTDEDIAEFRIVYAECLRRWPGSLGRTMIVGQPIIARPEDVKEKVDRRVAEIMDGYIGPARAEKQQEQAADEARRRIEQTRAANAAKADRLAAERTKSLTEEKLDRDRADAQARRDALDRQAQADLDAAESAKRLAAQEAPLIASAEKRALDARNARLEAERRLNESRQSLDRTRQALANENAGLKAVERRRLAEERQRHEQAEDDALARTCSITFQQFSKLALGMHLRDVRQTFGCTGVLISSDQIANSAVTTYRWDGATGSSYTIFENNFLTSKSQQGLD